MLKTICKRISLFFSFIFVSLVMFAQETKKIDIDIDTPDDKQWYQQPWAWVVFGAVFVLLLVALLRRKSD